MNACLNALLSKGLVDRTSFQPSEHEVGGVYATTLAGMAEIATVTSRLPRLEVAGCSVLCSDIETLWADRAMAPRAGDPLHVSFRCRRAT